jgi:hypothetical protein
MLGIGTRRRAAGEVRRDVRAAYERDPAATGKRHPTVQEAEVVPLRPVQGPNPAGG